MPVPVGATYGLWPMIPTNMSANNDCACPLCSGENECYLEDCHCINRTSYTVTLQTIDSASSTNHFLCLHNITEGIYIHFFSDIFAKCIKTGIYREYFHSYWISVGMHSYSSP